MDGDEARGFARSAAAGNHCCNDLAVQELLGFLVLDRLTAADWARVEHHLDECPPCVAEVVGFQEVTNALDLLTPVDVAELLAAPSHRHGRRPGTGTRTTGTAMTLLALMSMLRKR